ncbi:MAG: NADP-dependent oxidoreductase [Chloroflexi bacterium AL-W]|nr:NADP-dependent oxidoreductase [Chloroflexi bacterium AL-N1]NOK67067.1 NADP-dependent oxidoreductase [Chloroflexi bacterium AL-N10]NOK74641.1 NADP-dependent oxidoreductase [Chloroflexi bacterium AL-N5]NOK81669.1 NADP-dependent oxidoreductase [Chloroflexi bacterium AL-W]NOK89139.1 NADP-dependent oxidoreductase [Chloroflexi bacterium AL-N15]
MKAVRIYAYGESDVLTYEDVSVPTCNDNEVLIRVHAAGVNPVDWKTRIGRGIAGNIESFPVILGWDVSGVVEHVGARVVGLSVGDDVYGMVSFPQIGGAYAEYTTAPAAHLAHKPASLNHVQSAALPLAVLTAWQALFDTADLRAGQTVLIHAAAGGVGHFAVQLAKWKGAYVIGTASSANVAFLRELGIDEVIDYQNTRFEDVVRDVDVVLDGVGGDVLERSVSVLKPGGILVTILPEDTDTAKSLAQAHGARGTSIMVGPNQQQLVQIARLVDDGHIKPVIDTVLPLDEVRIAHAMSFGGHTRGKIVLQVR